MSPRSLFNIILKILGILLIKDILVIIPSLATVFGFFFNTSTDLTVVIPVLFTVVLYVWVTYMLIFRTEWVIDVFRLDHNFEEETFALNMHRSSILKIGIIIIGGILVVDAIPDVCYQVYTYWEQRKLSQSLLINYTPASLINVIVPAIKLITGLLLLGNTRAITNYIELKRRNSTIPEFDSSADQ